MSFLFERFHLEVPWCHKRAHHLWLHDLAPKPKPITKTSQFIPPSSLVWWQCRPCPANIWLSAQGWRWKHIRIIQLARTQPGCSLAWVLPGKMRPLTSKIYDLSTFCFNCRDVNPDQVTSISPDFKLFKLPQTRLWSADLLPIINFQSLQTLDLEYNYPISRIKIERHDWFIQNDETECFEYLNLRKQLIPENASKMCIFQIS